MPSWKMSGAAWHRLDLSDAGIAFSILDGWIIREYALERHVLCKV
jgi:hypothetical protein